MEPGENKMPMQLCDCFAPLISMCHVLGMVLEGASVLSESVCQDRLRRKLLSFESALHHSNCVDVTLLARTSNAKIFRSTRAWTCNTTRHFCRVHLERIVSRFCPSCCPCACTVPRLKSHRVQACREELIIAGHRSTTTFFRFHPSRVSPLKSRRSLLDSCSKDDT